MKRQSKKRIGAKKITDAIMLRRKETLDRMYHDPKRAGKFGKVCEGTAFVEHLCSGSMEGNEVLYTRQIIQKLDPVEWGLFFVEWNMSINCQFFHATYGHRTSFRTWFLSRVTSRYTIEFLRAWNDSLPLKDENRIEIP